MTTAMEEIVDETIGLRHARLTDALTRLTVASDTDAVAVEVDTDDLAACQQWLWMRRPILKRKTADGPVADLAYCAVQSATLTVNGRTRVNAKTVLAGADLTAYLALLHAVHAAEDN